jgi:hypothetical protein
MPAALHAATVSARSSLRKFTSHATAASADNAALLTAGGDQRGPALRRSGREAGITAAHVQRRRPMAAANEYYVNVYSGPDGYQTNRAQIALYGASGNVIAYIRFKDPEMPFQADYQSDGIIRMHLPSTMFQSVLDIVRNEKPIQIYFNQNRAFFATGAREPVGEGE